MIRETEKNLNDFAGLEKNLIYQVCPARRYLLKGLMVHFPRHFSLLARESLVGGCSREVEWEVESGGGERTSAIWIDSTQIPGIFLAGQACYIPLTYVDFKRKNLFWFTLLSLVNEGGSDTGFLARLYSFIDSKNAVSCSMFIQQ